MRAVVLLLAGCTGGASDGTTSGDDGDSRPVTTWPCADPVYFDASIQGRVTRDGQSASGADVRLEERNWDPGTVHGSGMSGTDGQFQFAVSDMPIIEGCWGWAAGFYVVAEQEGLSDDWPVNSIITSAWLEGEALIQLEGVTLELE